MLLIDHVNGSTMDTAVQRIELEKFLNRDSGELARPTSLAFLVDSGITIGNRVTQDGKSLAADLAQQTVGVRTVTTTQGIYGDAERLNLSLKGLWDLVSYEIGRPGRKLVIWISPGWPALARVMLDRKQQQEILQRVVNISGGLRMANITLYHVNPLGAAAGFDFQTTGYRKQKSGPPPSSPTGNLGLPVIATQSGGRVLNASNDIASEIAECGGCLPVPRVTLPPLLLRRYTDGRYTNGRLHRQQGPFQFSVGPAGTVCTGRFGWQRGFALRVGGNGQRASR